MPIYEYQCQACDHAFEKLQKISDEPLRDCPACLKPSLEKKVSAAGFRLSGGGWYETDFKSGDKKKNIAGEKDSTAAKTETKTEKADSKKAETAGAAKSETKAAPAKATDK